MAHIEEDPTNLANTPPAVAVAVPAAAGGGGGVGLVDGAIVRLLDGRTGVLINNETEVFLFNLMGEIRGNADVWLRNNMARLVVRLPPGSVPTGQRINQASMNAYRRILQSGNSQAAAEVAVAARERNPVKVRGKCGTILRNIYESVKEFFTRDALILTGSVAAIGLLFLAQSMLEDAGNSSMFQSLFGRPPTDDELIIMSDGRCSVMGGGKRRKTKHRRNKRKSIKRRGLGLKKSVRNM